MENVLADALSCNPHAQMEGIAENILQVVRIQGVEQGEDGDNFLCILELGLDQEQLEGLGTLPEDSDEMPLIDLARSCSMNRVCTCVWSTLPH